MPESEHSMRFVVSRTSGRFDESQPPCPEAFKGTLPSWDYRTCKTPEEFGERGLGDWFGEGTSEHGTYGKGEDRGIKRLEDIRKNANQMI